jgi:prepilin-type N-terminal cleavage/methylation domain-containing protein
MNRRAFTLLEMLVVILVLALIVALILPAIGGAKESAEHVQALSALRQMHTGVTLYTHDYDSCYPFFGVPGNPGAGITVNGNHIPSGQPDGHQFLVQHRDLYVSGVEKYLSGVMETPTGPAFQPAQTPQGPGPDGVYTSRLAFSQAFFARPEFWRDGGPHSPELVTATKATMARNPARKVMLLYSDPDLFAQNQLLICFADGSAKAEAWDTTSNIQPDPFGTFVIDTRMPGMATRDGVLGVDY